MARGLSILYQMDALRTVLMTEGWKRSTKNGDEIWECPCCSRLCTFGAAIERSKKAKASRYHRKVREHLDTGFGTDRLRMAELESDEKKKPESEGAPNG